MQDAVAKEERRRESWPGGERGGKTGTNGQGGLGETGLSKTDRRKEKKLTKRKGKVGGE